MRSPRGVVHLPSFPPKDLLKKPSWDMNPLALGSPSSAAVSALVMAHARDTKAQGLHSPASAFPLDEVATRDLAMLRARDILAKELDGLVYVDCVVVDDVDGEKAGLIKLVMK